jgi:hypothetical protein
MDDNVKDTNENCYSAVSCSPAIIALVFSLNKKNSLVLKIMTAMYIPYRKQKIIASKRKRNTVYPSEEPIVNSLHNLLCADFFFFFNKAEIAML